jgi:hypothetical protein
MRFVVITACFIALFIGISSGIVRYTILAYANNAPEQPVLIHHTDMATDTSILAVMVTDPDSDPMNITFRGRKVVPGTGEDFTIIVLPDTQLYAQSYPDIFTSQIQWIVDNEVDENIVFVTHLGDIVNNEDILTQWNIADTAIDLLDPMDIPYSVGPGNHDIGADSLYEAYFGISRFSSKSWYGGHYGSNNYNNYSLFSAGGIDFILINLQYEPTTEILDWADALLKANIDRWGIVQSHSILDRDNSWSNEGIYTALKGNPKLFLMLCGHNHTSSDGAAQRTEIGDYGNIIHVLMSDYQEYPSGGNGYLRIMRFSPADDRIYVRTYSPYMHEYLSDIQNQFELIFNMAGNAVFEVIGTINGVASGNKVSITLSDLDPDTEYNCYVEVSDGTDTTTSSICDFTTATNDTRVITDIADQMITK